MVYQSPLDGVIAFVTDADGQLFVETARRLRQ
jgi:hypothetical protein